MHGELVLNVEYGGTNCFAMLTLHCTALLSSLYVTGFCSLNILAAR
jgi:hypothetical protein